MGKLGVGIGDEFPLEDGKPAGSGQGGERDAEYEKRREEFRKARDAWREQRRQWRDEWHARRRAFRDEMRARYGDAYDGDDHHWRSPYWGSGSHHHLLQLLLIVGLIMLVIAIFSHIYILFGLVVLAGLYFAYRGGFDHFDFPDNHHSASPPSAPPGAKN
jgi:hypothetical protein